MPYKESIIQHLSSLSKESKSIGAVNTIKVQETENTMNTMNTMNTNSDRNLVGHNTDWLGIRDTLKRAVEALYRKGEFPSNKPPEGNFNFKALIIGAGGTARAAAHALIGDEPDQTRFNDNGENLGDKNDSFNEKFYINLWGSELGLQAKNVYVYNRTLTKALDFANRFGCNFVKSLDEFFLNDGEFLILIITVPAEAKLTFPRWICNYKKSIVLDLCYTEEETFHMKQVKSALAKMNGVEVLIRQALYSIEIWTGKMVSIDVDDIRKYLEESNKKTNEP